MLPRLFRALRDSRLPFMAGPRGLILLYHRIAEPALDPWQLSVSPANFDAHMRAVAALAVPLTLDELNDARLRRRIPAGAVAVTFDDGYADNLIAGVPVLRRHAIPATVFVTTAPVQSGAEYWWDQVERVLLSPGTLPSVLRVATDRETWTWHLGTDAEYSPENAARDACWRVHEPVPTRRHFAYLQLCERLRSVAPRQRDAVLEQLAELGKTGRTARESHRPLQLAEIRQLAISGVVRIGAHTVHHPALSTRPAAEQRAELAESRANLEDWTGTRVDTLSYPFGGSNAWSMTTAQLALETGFRCACTTRAGAVTNRDRAFQLPRLYVHDYTEEQFVILLRSALGGAR